MFNILFPVVNALKTNDVELALKITGLRKNTKAVTIG